MATKLQESILLVLTQFDRETPITILEALQNLGNDELSGISLYLRPVSGYIKNNLVPNHYLDKVEGGYVLAAFGEKEKERLLDELATHPRTVDAEVYMDEVRKRFGENNPIFEGLFSRIYS